MNAYCKRQAHLKSARIGGVYMTDMGATQPVPKSHAVRMYMKRITDTMNMAEKHSNRRKRNIGLKVYCIYSTFLCSLQTLLCMPIAHGL